MSKAMKIRITGASVKTYWYADAIGKVYTVEKTVESERKYQVDGGWYVNFEDCEEVIEHNSQLYRKVDRPVREGDTVLITKFEGADVNIIRTVTKLIEEFPGDFRFMPYYNFENYFDNVKEEYSVIEPIQQLVTGPSALSYAEVSELLHEASRQTRIDNAFEKVVARNGAALKRLADSDDIVEHSQNELVEVNGKQYRKVKRKSAVGDLVVVTNKRGGEYREGEVLTVIEALYEHVSDAFPGVLSKEYPEYDSWLYHNEYETLELVEQYGQLDLIANLAQEVASLKKDLHRITGAVIDAQSDIVDLEDRVDENEKDVEEVIGRMNDLGDGAEAEAVVPVAVIEKVIAELEEAKSKAVKDAIFYGDENMPRTAAVNRGFGYASEFAIDTLKEALRNG